MWKQGFKDIKRLSEARLKNLVKEPPVLEPKHLPSYLEYAFLEKDSKLPVIISPNLTSE